MHERAIEELKRDWAQHARAAAAGDARCAYAATEALERLEELGADHVWLCAARAGSGDTLSSGLVRGPTARGEAA